MSFPSIDNTTLTALTPNLDIGDVADPALRLAYFQYLNTYLASVISLLNATTAGASGAHNIGSASISGVTGSTVYAQLADIFSQLQGASAGTIVNRSIEAIKIALLTITEAEIANSTITSAKIASDTIAYSNMSTSLKTDLNGGLIYAYKNLGGAL